MSICSQQKENYFDFSANLWLMVLSKRENFVHSLSLFFLPLVMHLWDSLQATNLHASCPCIFSLRMAFQTARLFFFFLPAVNLVNILSDFPYYSILAPCTNKTTLNQKYRFYSNYYNCCFFTLSLFYLVHRRCGVDNDHVQAGGQTTKCLESFRAPIFKMPRLGAETGDPGLQQCPGFW